MIPVTQPFTLAQVLAAGSDGGGATITDAIWGGATIGISEGGTGQTSKASAFDALSPLLALGALIYGGIGGTGTQLPGNTTTTQNLLAQTGTGSGSAAPAWNSLTSILDTLFGSAQGTIAFRGASGWQALTPGTNGYALTSGGSGADLAWAAAGGGSPGGSNNDIQINASGAFGGGRGTLDSSGNLTLAPAAPSQALPNLLLYNYGANGDEVPGIIFGAGNGIGGIANRAYIATTIKSSDGSYSGVLRFYTGTGGLTERVRIENGPTSVTVAAGASFGAGNLTVDVSGNLVAAGTASFAGGNLTIGTDGSLATNGNVTGLTADFTGITCPNPSLFIYKNLSMQIHAITDIGGLDFDTSIIGGSPGNQVTPVTWLQVSSANGGFLGTGYIPIFQ